MDVLQNATSGQNQGAFVDRPLGVVKVNWKQWVLRLLLKAMSAFLSRIEDDKVGGRKRGIGPWT